MGLHRYRFGGLDLRSNVALRGARPPGDEPGNGIDTSLTFVAGVAPKPDAIHSRGGGRYQLRLGSCGDRWLFDSALDGTFLLSPDGATLDIYCSTLPPQQEVIDVLLRRVLPRVAILSGKVAIHAAAAAREDNALLLVGPSRAGKSTTAAYLVGRAGWHGLGEDYSILADPDDPVVEPGPTGVCVWPDMRDGLELPPAACSEMPGTGGKIRFEPDAARALPPPRLRAIVALDRTDVGAGPSLAPLSRGEALIETTRQLVLFNPEKNLREELAIHMAHTNAILRKVPAFRLRYPADPQMLPRTAQMLEELVRR